MQPKHQPDCSLVGRLSPGSFVPSSWRACWAEGCDSLLVVDWRLPSGIHHVSPSVEQRTAWLLASIRASTERARQASQRAESFISSFWKWHRITFVTFCSLERSPPLLPRLREVITRRRRYQEAGWGHWEPCRKLPPQPGVFPGPLSLLHRTVCTSGRALCDSLHVSALRS